MFKEKKRNNEQIRGIKCEKDITPEYYPFKIVKLLNKISKVTITDGLEMEAIIRGKRIQILLSRQKLLSTGKTTSK